MKHQYVGDINDYRKYVLLRALSAGGANRIGECWMLTPDDGGTDGNKLGFLQQPDRFRHFDPELFDILAHAAGEPDAMYLLSILKGMQLNLDIPFPDDPRDPNATPIRPSEAGKMSTLTVRSAGKI